MYGAAILEPPVQPVVLPVTGPAFGDSPTELNAATVYEWLVHALRPETVALVVVTVARTVEPSYTRYPETVPLDALQDSERELFVLPVTDGLPGVPGTPAQPAVVA